MDYNYDREPYFIASCRSRAFIAKDTYLVADTDGYVKPRSDDDDAYIFGKAHRDAILVEDTYIVEVRLNMALMHAEAFSDE